MVKQEAGNSRFVVVGNVIHRQVVVDPEVDPMGYEAELFQVEVEKVVHGRPSKRFIKPYLVIYNSNTSARFPMEVGGRI